jgi:chemotaxis protein MotA
MDLLTIVGMFVGLFAIAFGQFLEGGHIFSLLNAPALIIVLGGTCGAVMIETPWHTFVRSIVLLPWILVPPESRINEYVKKITNWYAVAKRKGILGLEVSLAEESDEFTKKGLTLLIDKGDAKSLRKILSLEIEAKLRNELEAVKVFESMGGYAPTIGIIGAVIGLIQVMSNLSEPGKLGLGIAVAFVATIYGVGLANLFFIPVANKLRRVIIDAEKVHEMIMEGLISIAEGENLHVLELKLLGFAK